MMFSMSFFVLGGRSGSFKVASCLSHFGSLSCFYLVVYGLFGSLMLKRNFLILSPNSQ